MALAAFLNECTIEIAKKKVASTYFYRPQRSCEGYVFFTCVCHSVHRGGGVCLSASWDTTAQETPPEQTPPGADTPLPKQTPPGSRHPPQEQTPSQDGYCCGRYASYWNAFLFNYIVIILGTVSAHLHLANAKKVGGKTKIEGNSCFLLPLSLGVNVP